MAVTVVEPDAGVAHTLLSALNTPASVLPSLDAARRQIDSDENVDVVVVGPSLDLSAAAHFAGTVRVTRPELGVVLVRRRVDTVVLAEAMRSGMREVVDMRDLASLGKAVDEAHHIATEMKSATGVRTEDSDAPRGTVVTVFSAKGGAGKTTVATNLAAAFAQGGKQEVCLVDLDLAFGDVAIALQLFPAHTIADAVPLRNHLDDAGLTGLLTPHSPGLTTLVAPVQPDAKDAISAELVGRLLELLRARFDFVVVDTPPAFDDHVLAAIDRTDVLLLITTLDVPALKNLKLSLETLELLNFPRSQWRVVLNRANTRVGLAVSEVSKTLGVGIAAQIPSAREVPATINRGVMILQDDPRHPVSHAIRELASSIANTRNGVPRHAASPADTRESKRGFLRRRSNPS
jgi:pilus assembly protein CpaE